MRWTFVTIGASLALSGSAYASSMASMAIDGPVGGLFQRQAGSGRCGSDNGNAKCPAGQCCSQWGYCGVGNEFCNPIALCQSDYGSCLGMSQSATPAPAPTTTAAPPPPVTTTTQAPPPPPPTTTTAAPPPPTTTARPPPVTTTTTPPSSTSQAPPPPPIQPGPGGALIPSPNGMCGNVTTCAGSGRGSCCSQFFYCGDGIDYCGTGCQSKFGLCFGGVAAAPPAPAPVQSQSKTTPAAPATTVSTPAAPASSAAPSTTSAAAAPPAPSATPVTLPPGVSVTTDGSCGNGKTCLGSTFGACCSQFGFCGTGDQFCPAIVACQPEWGRCDS